jgi:hypothetical protein
MTWIDDIRKAYTDYFKEPFEKLGLEEYEKMDGPGMGALVKYKHDSFRLQIINDRGILETDISPLFEEEQFRGIELFYSYLTLSTITTRISEIEKRKILRTRLDYQAQAAFLTDNSKRLKDLLDKKNLKDTLKKIDTLAQERFDFQFK